MPVTTGTYTLSLHDALPISTVPAICSCSTPPPCSVEPHCYSRASCCGNAADRKSTRLNSSHLGISYAVFCLKKKMPLVVHSFCGNLDCLRITLSELECVSDL